jgi:hypothetical protein
LTAYLQTRHPRLTPTICTLSHLVTKFAPEPLFRHLQGVLDLHPDQQAWAGKARDVLREAHTAVEAAKVAKATELDPVLLGGLRARLRQGRHLGTNHQPAPRLGRQRKTLS